MATAVRDLHDRAFIGALTQALGSQYVLTDEADRLFYAHDVFRAAELPAVVVQPGTVAELQAVVRIAHDAAVPLVVRGGGASYTDAYVHAKPGGITVDTGRLTRIDIDETNAIVTAEVGVTWKMLHEALAARGYKTRFWGSYSGLHATIGGGLSMNSISHGPGVSAESLVCIEVITGTGEVLKTGSAGSGDAAGFFRFYGPDLAGLFTGDCGVLGVKARASFALVKAAPAFATASFDFPSFDAMHAALRAVALEDLVVEHFGLDQALQQGQIGKADMGDKLDMAGAVLKKSGSLLEGVGKLAKMAVSGDKALRQSTYAGHFITESISAEDAKGRIARVKALCSAHGKEIPNSVPEVVRVMPFAPFHNTLGPKGERWLPMHALLAHDQVVPFHHALMAYWHSQRGVMNRYGIFTGGMFMAVGSSAFVYEPTFYWPDEQTPYHARIVEPDHLKSLPVYRAAPEARAEVKRMKAEVIALMHAHGSSHLQIGKNYPYAKDRNPASWALLQGIKAVLDPKAILNPGALGL
jgi:FAD/FMN-containing dehydrogenase